MVTVLNQEQWNEKSFLIEPRELDTIHENQSSSFSSSSSSILQSPTSEDSESSTESIFGIESDEEIIKSEDDSDVPELAQMSFEMMESIYMSPVVTRYRSSLRFHRTSSCRLIEINKNPVRPKGEVIAKREQTAWDMDLSLTASDFEFVQNEKWVQQKSNGRASQDFRDDSDLSLQLVLFTSTRIVLFLHQFSFQ